VKPGVKRILYFFIIIEIIISIFNFLIYFGGFDGDPLIHVSYAEMASRGHWFNFNLSEVSSGVTSFFWLFIGALGWLIEGIKGCLFVYDGLILISWLGGAGILGYLVYRWGGNSIFGVMAAVFYMGFPGIAANGLTGMENMTFAFFLYIFILIYSIHIEGKFFSRRWISSGIILGILLGLQILTRPEGVIVSIAFAGFEIWRIYTAKNYMQRKNILKHLLLISAVSCLIVFPMWGFHYIITGNLIPESGVARLMSARRMSTSIHLFGPIWLYTRTLIRMISYLPITIGLGLSVYILKRNFFVKAKKDNMIQKYPSLVFSVIVALLGILLYTFITGALHVNRYTIWIVGISTAVFFVLVAQFIQLLSEKKSKILMTAIMFGVIWMSMVHLGEGYIRFKRGDHIKLKDWNTIIHNVNNREKQTDDLINLLERHGYRHNERAIGVLLQEVQIRLCFDDRIKIFSRDGRTQVLDYNNDGCPDLRPVLKNLDVIIIMDNLNSGTIKGRIKDDEVLELAELYENENISETQEWKKIWYKSYPEILMYNSSDSSNKPFPILIRKFKKIS